MDAKHYGDLHFRILTARGVLKKFSWPEYLTPEDAALFSLHYNVLRALEEMESRVLCPWDFEEEALEPGDPFGNRAGIPEA